MQHATEICFHISKYKQNRKPTRRLSPCAPTPHVDTKIQKINKQTNKFIKFTYFEPELQVTSTNSHDS